MKEYHFEIEDAGKYGVNEAIILYNLKFWIEKNKANEKHFYDDCYWTYNSYKAFKEIFPFWNETQIKYIINSLVKKGVIKKGNYNKNKYNKTNWYTIIIPSNGQNCPIEGKKMSDQTDNNVHSNTYSNTNVKADNKPCKTMSPESNHLAQLLYDEIVRNSNPTRYKTTPPKLKSWSEDISKLLNIDKIDYDLIHRVIIFATADKDFWSQNILSGGKLRKHFNQLELKMNSSKKNNFIDEKATGEMVDRLKKKPKIF